MAANDEQALAELVAIHAQSLHDVAYMILRDSALAADAVQDVFIRIWHRRSALDVTGTVAGYLVRAVRNRALDIAKHERSQQRLARTTTDQYVIDVATSHQDNPEMAPERSLAFTQAVDAAVRSLTPRVRETFLLALVQGMTYAEIGAALGVSVMTVQSQLSRAVAQLRRSLAVLRSD
jgi:RNA polymerase sigma-70 factor (ECF subfamily)